MGANYVKLETITVGEAGASSVTFNNIPQTGYTDLKVVYSARTDNATSGVWDNIYAKVNGSSTGYSFKMLYTADSATPTSAGTTDTKFGYLYAPRAAATANTFGSGEFYIPNYTSSNQKSVSADIVVENNGSANFMDMWAGLWSGTSAITSFNIYIGSGNFVQYSTFSLYGLAAVGTTPVIAPYASGGDIIQTDGTYWYHAFLSSGTFTPAKGLSCDYLVVAGGGGGSGANAGNAGHGAGGAGGLRSTVTATGGGGSVESALALTSNTAYTVTIGAGGNGGAGGSNNNGSIGGNTVFASITSIGGGYGGGTGVGGNGGSGGGGRYGSSGGTGTSGQGYAGGANAGANGSFGGAGGGGAGGVGASISSAGNQFNGGAGGVGIYTAISDSLGTLAGLGQLSSSHYYFAGGGAGSAFGSGGIGGTGGLGGGGNGVNDGSSAAGGNGTPSTGGGGAAGTGTTSGSAGGKGGSGIVIVRYAI